MHLGGDARGDRRVRAGAVARRGRRAAVRAARAAEPVRPVARARGEAHGVGLLPRPERLAGRHDRADRGAGRALRTGLPRADPRPVRDGAGRAGGAQPELRRRRHQRRRRGPAADLRAARSRPSALLDAAARRLPLLVLDAAGRRRPRHVRLPRRARGARVRPSRARACARGPRGAQARGRGCRSAARARRRAGRARRR